MSRRIGWAIKRGVDVTLSGVALVVLIPLLGVVALLIVLDDPGPVFFHQARAGRHGRPFRLVKLRTMRVNDVPPDELGEIANDHPLVTRVGAWLRRFKVDELPQLINVLRGDMSLVGPRPTLPEQARNYDGFERRRLELRPGVTGWAQVNGNVRLAWHERILLDVWYLDHWSLLLDLRILFRTVAVVLRGEDPNTTALHEALTYANGIGRRC